MLGTQPVTLNLCKNTGVGDGRETRFTGYFYYDSEENPMQVYGGTDEKNFINLDIWSRDGSAFFFNGKQTDGGIFSGTWQDTVSVPHKILPFNLKEVYNDASLRFSFTELADSLILFKNTKDSPRAEFSGNILVPTTSTDKNIAAFLNKAFLTPDVEVGNSSEEKLKFKKITYTDGATMFKMQRDSFFKDYSETMKDEKPDDDYNRNYAQTTENAVVYNADNLLSIATMSYETTGGAHGMSIITLSSYDLKSLKKLSLDDVFKPGYKPTVNAILEKAVRKQENIKPDELLSSVLFTDKMEVTDNFCVTRKGILFLYNSDEIASHAQGEFDFFIPFTDLKSVLK